MYLLKLVRRKQIRLMNKLKFVLYALVNLNKRNEISLIQDAFDSENVFLGKDNCLGKHLSLIVHSSGSISFGNNCKIENYCILESLHDSIKLGDHCSLNQFCVIRAYGEITIGNGVRIGPAVQILSMKHNFSDRSRFIWEQGISGTGIVIGDNVWIGANSVILDGVKIGNNCVIGASSVVTKDIEENSIAVGNPCKRIKPLYS